MDVSDLSTVAQYTPQATGLAPEELRLRQLSAACKRLFSSLQDTDISEPLSIIADALESSSIDHPAESPNLTLDPVVRTHGLISYWSSAGSEDANSAEWVAYRLVHPLCVVQGMQIRPFRAWFQRGNPIYASKKVRIDLGGLPLAPPPLQSPALLEVARLNSDRMAQEERGAVQEEEGYLHRQNSTAPCHVIPWISHGKKTTWGDWVTKSEEYPMLKEDTLQTIDIPRSLCVGGYLQLDLLGRTQTQDSDDLYYSECIRMRMSFYLYILKSSIRYAF